MHTARISLTLGLLILSALNWDCTTQSYATKTKTSPTASEASGGNPANYQSAAANLAAEEIKVRETLDRFFRAADKKDWQAVEEILAPDFEEYYSDDLLIYKRDDFIKTMDGDNMIINKMELKDVKVNVSPDGQMAWVKYQVLLESSLRGKIHNIHSLETAVFKKEGAKWKMVHAQASLKEL